LNIFVTLFTLSGTKFYIFIFQKCISHRSEKMKSKKILYDKYAPIAIRDDHVDNHFIDKFLSMCHVGYFINGDGWKLTAGYIWGTFYTFWD